VQWLNATKQNTTSPQEDATGSIPLAKVKTPETARPSRRGKGSTHLAKVIRMQLPLNWCNLTVECMHSTRLVYKLSRQSCVIYLSSLLTHAHIKP
jgi:hypothetical protein